MTDAERIENLERQVKELQRQVLDISELLGKQSNLIVTVSSQQTESSRLLALFNAAVQEASVAAPE